MSKEERERERSYETIYDDMQRLISRLVEGDGSRDTSLLEDIFECKERLIELNPKTPDRESINRYDTRYHNKKHMLDGLDDFIMLVKKFTSPSGYDSSINPAKLIEIRNVIDPNISKLDPQASLISSSARSLVSNKARST